MVTPEMVSLTDLYIPAPLTEPDSPAETPPAFVLILGWIVLAAVGTSIIGLVVAIWSGLGPAIAAVLFGFYLATR